LYNPIPGRSILDDLPGIKKLNDMEQIDEKKNSEELIGLINSGTKDIFNKKEVASRLGEDVANRIKDRLEEKKDEKRGN